MSKKIRVLITDDHRVVREGLSAILDTKDEIDIVGEASDGREAVEKARELLPDVIVMDVSMPGMNGVEATRIIKKELPQIGIIALTSRHHRDGTHSCRQKGRGSECPKKLGS